VRNVPKTEVPPVLAENAARWTVEFEADRTDTNRHRYRDPDIKSALMAETDDKCVYCESKVGHNCPGDVEHKLPVLHRPDLLFDWSNMTIACSECNRRKGSYHNDNAPFLDPNEDDVEARLMHVGVLVWSAPGDACATITVRTLELDQPEARRRLIGRKYERLESVRNLVERISGEHDPTVRAFLLEDLNGQCSRGAEFSGMTKAYVDGLPPDWPIPSEPDPRPLAD
jgi:hypothetical protein